MLPPQSRATCSPNPQPHPDQPAHPDQPYPKTAAIPDGSAPAKYPAAAPTSEHSTPRSDPASSASASSTRSARAGINPTPAHHLCETTLPGYARSTGASPLPDESSETRPDRPRTSKSLSAAANSSAASVPAALAA